MSTSLPEFVKFELTWIFTLSFTSPFPEGVVSPDPSVVIEVVTSVVLGWDVELVELSVVGSTVVETVAADCGIRSKRRS